MTEDDINLLREQFRNLDIFGQSAVNAFLQVNNLESFEQELQRLADSESASNDELKQLLENETIHTAGRTVAAAAAAAVAAAAAARADRVIQQRALNANQPNQRLESLAKTDFNNSLIAARGRGDICPTGVQRVAILGAEMQGTSGDRRPIAVIIERLMRHALSADQPLHIDVIQRYDRVSYSGFINEMSREINEAKERIYIAKVGRASNNQEDLNTYFWRRGVTIRHQGWQASNAPPSNAPRRGSVWHTDSSFFERDNDQFSVVNVANPILGSNESNFQASMTVMSAADEVIIPNMTHMLNAADADALAPHIRRNAHVNLISMAGLKNNQHGFSGQLNFLATASPFTLHEIDTGFGDRPFVSHREASADLDTDNALDARRTVLKNRWTQWIVNEVRNGNYVLALALELELDNPILFDITSGNYSVGYISKDNANKEAPGPGEWLRDILRHATYINNNNNPVGGYRHTVFIKKGAANQFPSKQTDIDTIRDLDAQGVKVVFIHNRIPQQELWGGLIGSKYPAVTGEGTLSEALKLGVTPFILTPINMKGLRGQISGKDVKKNNIPALPPFPGRGEPRGINTLFLHDVATRLPPDSHAAGYPLEYANALRQHRFIGLNTFRQPAPLNPDPRIPQDGVSSYEPPADNLQWRLALAKAIDANSKAGECLIESIYHRLVVEPVPASIVAEAEPRDLDRGPPDDEHNSALSVEGQPRLVPVGAGSDTIHAAAIDSIINLGMPTMKKSAADIDDELNKIAEITNAEEQQEKFIELVTIALNPVVTSAEGRQKLLTEGNESLRNSLSRSVGLDEGASLLTIASAIAEQMFATEPHYSIEVGAPYDSRRYPLLAVGFPAANSALLGLLKKKTALIVDSKDFYLYSDEWDELNSVISKAKNILRSTENLKEVFNLTALQEETQQFIIECLDHQLACANYESDEGSVILDEYGENLIQNLTAEREEQIAILKKIASDESESKTENILSQSMLTIGNGTFTNDSQSVSTAGSSPTLSPTTKERRYPSPETTLEKRDIVTVSLSRSTSADSELEISGADLSHETKEFSTIADDVIVEDTEGEFDLAKETRRMGLSPIPYVPSPADSTTHSPRHVRDSEIPKGDKMAEPLLFSTESKSFVERKNLKSPSEPAVPPATPKPLK